MAKKTDSCILAYTANLKLGFWMSDLDYNEWFARDRKYVYKLKRNQYYTEFPANLEVSFCL